MQRFLKYSNLGDFLGSIEYFIRSKFLTPVFAPEWMGAVIYLKKDNQTLQQISEEQILFPFLWILNATLVTSEC